MSIAFIITILVSYLVGSIPFGIIISRLGGFQDPRKVGSGNIGATNMLRSAGKLPALLTLLCDGLKGVAAILLARYILQESTDSLIVFAGIFSVFGHMAPIWLKFKGGKGVATAFGVLFAWNLWFGGMIALTWSLVFAATRFSSLAALIGLSMTIPLSILFVRDPHTPVVFAILFFVIAWKHRANIRRLLKGEELRFGKKE